MCKFLKCDIKQNKNYCNQATYKLVTHKASVQGVCGSNPSKFTNCHHFHMVLHVNGVLCC
jgi:hypothetical protein